MAEALGDLSAYIGQETGPYNLFGLGWVTMTGDGDFGNNGIHRPAGSPKRRWAALEVDGGDERSIGGVKRRAWRAYSTTRRPMVPSFH